MKTEKVKLVKRAVTEKDFELNPELVEGVELGTVMKLPELPDEEETDMTGEDEIDESDSEDESEDEDKENESGPVGKVTFHLNNANTPSKTSTRVFSAKEHGKDFKDIANGFEESNTLKKPTLSPADPDYREHVEEVVLHNRNIKSHILKREEE